MRCAVPLAAAAAIALSIGLTAAASAENSPEGDAFLRRLYARAQDKTKTYVCFTRAYDADHLARHPLQKVSEMKLLVTAEKDAEDGNLSHSFRLGFKYRNRSGQFDSSGQCMHANTDESGKTTVSTLGCSVDCDGGGFNVGLNDDNKSVMLRLERIRVWRNHKPDEDASYELDGGTDDRVFRLERVDVKQCAPLVTDRKELAAMRTK